MKIAEFIDAYKAQRFINIRQGIDEKSEWLKKTLEIKTYIPIMVKREIAEMIVKKTTTVVNGIKKHDSIDSYISFVVAMITAHTNLQFNEDPVMDYDLLAESGLLPQIIMEFKPSYDECDTILKMTLAMELEDNNPGVLIGQFLDGILGTLQSIDFNKILGANIKEEDLTKLKRFLNKFNK